jgi:uroporphyrinogen III methyltransferase/synthase
MTPATSSGRVYLVGAGPGDPGLLTLRAVECLRRADLIIYDRLVDKRALEFSSQAEQLCVTDLPGSHPERGPQVHERLIAAARSGRTVVRLKGGDPYLFGRGGEEAAALRAAGVPFEVVPGVTAALAAGACTGVPLTHRECSSAVAFVTGHESSDKGLAALDWAALARFPGTLAVYMGLARLSVIAETLIRHGKSPATPVLAVQHASTNHQRTVEGTLGNIAECVAAAQLQGPVVTLIGAVVQLRGALDWFSARPLFGRRVLVTRPRRQADALQRQLEELGATVLVLPAVAIGPPPDEHAVQRILERLGEFQWLVFTSVNGVESFLRYLDQSGRDWRALAGLRLAAIGPKTAAALRTQHLRPDVVPPDFCSESLAESLAPLVTGQRVLLARADRGREVLHEQLSRVAQVEQLAVYSQVDCMTADEQVMAEIRRGHIDYVTLTSSNIARAFARLLDEECRQRLGKETHVITISPVTSAAARELGIPVAAEAAEATIEGLVAAILNLAGKKK